MLGYANALGFMIVGMLMVRFYQSTILFGTALVALGFLSLVLTHITSHRHLKTPIFSKANTAYFSVAVLLFILSIYAASLVRVAKGF